MDRGHGDNCDAAVLVSEAVRPFCLKDRRCCSCITSIISCSRDARFGGILYFYDTWGEKLKYGPLNDPPSIVPSLLRDSELAMRFTVVATKWDRFSEKPSIDVRQEKKNLESTRICNVLKPKRNPINPQGISHYILHSQNNSESARKAVDRLLDLPAVPLKRLKVLRPTIKVLPPAPSVNPEVAALTRVENIHKS